MIQEEKRSACKSLSKNTFILLLLILFSIFIECSSKFGKYTYINYKRLKRPERTVKLCSTLINKKFNINRVYMIKIIGNYLIVADNEPHRMIKIVDLKSEELLKSFGSKGEGPNEFMGISQIIQDPKYRNTFWIYDIQTKYLKRFNIEKVLNNGPNPEEIMRIQFEKSGVPFELIFTPENKILGIGRFFKGRISIYDMRGTYLKNIGKIPVILENERFAPQHSHGFQGKFIYKDRSKEIFIAVRLGSIVEKYSIDGSLISTFYGPDVFFPEYRIVPVGIYHTMTYNNKSRFGYIDICFNKKLDRIFLLYSGRYQSDIEKKRVNYGANIIYVLDEKETISEKIELDKEILSIDISDDGSTIFGSSETDILKFEYSKKY